MRPEAKGSPETPRDLTRMKTLRIITTAMALAAAIVTTPALFAETIVKDARAWKEILGDARPVPHGYGVNWVDLNGDGRKDVIMVGRRDEGRVTSDLATPRFYLARKGDFLELPIDGFRFLQDGPTEDLAQMQVLHVEPLLYGFYHKSPPEVPARAYALVRNKKTSMIIVADRLYRFSPQDLGPVRFDLYVLGKRTESQDGIIGEALWAFRYWGSKISDFCTNNAHHALAIEFAFLTKGNLEKTACAESEKP